MHTIELILASLDSKDPCLKTYEGLYKRPVFWYSTESAVGRKVRSLSLKRLASFLASRHGFTFRLRSEEASGDLVSLCSFFSGPDRVCALAINIPSRRAVSRCADGPTRDHGQSSGDCLRGTAK